MNRNKKILIIIITIFMFFSLTSCKKESVESIKKEVYEKLNWASTYSSLDINIVGKYGKGYYIDIGNNDFYRHAQFMIDGIEIPMYNFADSHFYFVDEKLYSPEAAYSLGYLVKEDLYSIRERYLEHNRKIDIDYPLIDPNPQLERCIHKTDGWKITKTATCVEAGKKILLCKKCDKELESVDIYREPHNYVNGKCTYCKDKEYTYTDTYKETPENMINFYGTYNNVSIFSALMMEEYKYYLRKIEDIIFELEERVVVLVQYYKKEYNKETKEYYDVLTYASLEEAYEEGIINKNVLLEMQKKLNEENSVGNNYYNNYSKNDKHPKEFYLNYIENLQNSKNFQRICEENLMEEKHLIYISTTYYGEYSNYYVGKYEEYFAEDYAKTSNNLHQKGYMVGGYKFLKNQNEKFVVCNEKEMYDLRTAYRKRIINKEDLQEIYNIYSFYFNYDE